MHYLLIANNPNIDTIPTEGYDAFIHFNGAIHWGKTPQDKSEVWVRNAYTVRDAKNFRPYPNTQHPTKVRAVGWLREIKAFFEQTGCEQVPIVNVGEAPYPEGKSPTSGWAAIWHCLNRDIQVTVIGFDLKVASYYNTTRLHDMAYEIEGLQKLIDDGEISKI